MNYLKLIYLTLFSTVLYANSCPKYFPLPMPHIEENLVVVIPIYDSSITASDLDCDGIIDTLDPDIDGDGVKNTLDDFPLDPFETNDSDGDGLGDNADKPIANAQTIIIEKNTIDNNITLAGTDDDSLTFIELSSPSHGTLSGTPPTLNYTPDANYTGIDYFTFKANDGMLTSLSATVTIHIKDDITPPIISLTGDNPQYIEKGTPYVELGATTNDDSIVSINNSDVNTSVNGSYIVTYNAIDDANNTALKITREVIVAEDITSFNIKNNAESSIEINGSSPYVNNGSAPGLVLSPNGNIAYIANREAGLSIIDITNPQKPIQLGTYDTGNYAENVVLSADGNTAYIANYAGGLHIVNVSNPEHPEFLASYATPSFSKDIVLSSDGQTAYVADGGSGLQIFNISNPTNPIPIGNFKTSGWAEGIALSDEGNTIYIAGGKSGLNIINITDPSSPSLIRSFNPRIGEWSYDVTVSSSKNVAFLANADKGTYKIDISSPSNPSVISECYRNAVNITLSEDENTLYISDYSSNLLVEDVSLTTGTLIKRYASKGKSQAVAISSDGKFAYLISRIKKENSRNASILQVINIVEPQSNIIGNYNISNLKGPLTLSPNKNTIFLTGGDGSTILDIATPSNPQYVSSQSSNLGYSNEIVLNKNGNIAYRASGKDGLEIFEISPSNDFNLIGSYKGDVTIEPWDDPDPMFDSVNPYDVICSASGVVLSKDKNTAYVACGGTPLAFRDAQNGTALQIIDISISNNPRLIGKYEISGGFGRSLALSDDQSKIILASGREGVKVIDISMPSSPRLIGSYDTSYAMDVLLSKNNDFIYVADFWGGLKIIDISNPSNLSLVSTVNTYAKNITLSKDKNIIYVSGDDLGTSLKLIDVSIPSNPRFITSYGVKERIYSSILSADESLAYILGSSGLSVVDTKTSRQHVRKNFLERNLNIMIHNTLNKTMKLTIETDRNDIITIGSYNSEIDAEQYHNKEISVPVQSIKDAIGTTIITITISYDGKSFEKKVYFNVD